MKFDLFILKSFSSILDKFINLLSYWIAIFKGMVFYC